MNTTRRRFIQMIGAAVALIKAPLPAIADSLPRLVGDGMHNDAPALNALLNRIPIEIGPLVNIEGAGWDGLTLTLPRGNFLIRAPIIVADAQEGMTLDANGSQFLVGEEAECAMRIFAVTVTLKNAHFKSDIISPVPTIRMMLK